MTERIVPNRCTGTRAEIEGKAYRMISFFHEHPSEIAQDEWNTLKVGDDVYIVDKLTFSLMGECECELMTHEGGGADGTIAAVRLTEKNNV